MWRKTDGGKKVLWRRGREETRGKDGRGRGDGEETAAAAAGRCVGDSEGKPLALGDDTAANPRASRVTLRPRPLSPGNHRREGDLRL